MKTSRIHRITTAVILVGLASMTACRRAPKSTIVSEATDESSERVFFVRGVVQELPADDPTRVIIDHEEMAGYMGAMIMPFRAKAADELKGLEPGMVIDFDYHVRDRESWITNITDVGQIGEIKEAETDGASTTTPLSVGDVLPDYEFIDETGARVKLSDFRGAPVAMTFVFSRCPVPEYCPAMMRNFKHALDALKSDPEAPDRFHLLTISFDSFNDTPETMKTWGAAFGHEPGDSWSLLTSETCCTITDISGNVGLKYGEVNGSYQHNLRTVVLDPAGRIRKIFTDETWKVEQLVREIKAAASPPAKRGAE